MRYVVIGLGAITLAVAVVLASENQWWIAFPDALFGLGVAFMAYGSLRAEHHQPSSPSQVIELPVPPVTAHPVPPPPAPAQVTPPPPACHAQRRRRH